MSSWSVVTLDMEEELRKYHSTGLSPTSLNLDSGVDEQGWADREELIYYALSFGRYQYRRFEEHMRDFHAPQFSGIKRAFIADVENTGDTVTVKVYEPKQNKYEERKDGYEIVDSFEGEHFPQEEAEALLDRIEDVYDIRPLLLGPDTTVPPDMVMTI